MKKTFTINISGTVFHIDDDAYERLNNYIFQVNRHFGNDADAKEIVQDIESRISELFQERIKDGSEVITIGQVEEIIKIMGMPEAFADSNEAEEVIKTKITRSHGRKLYRDPDDRILGGVCSGLGIFFNIDPIIVRLVFILLFFGGGSSFIIYLIMWIVVPKAANTAQRLEMKGEEVNINNISKTIKEEIQDVKENYQNFRASKSYIRSRERLDDAGSIVVSVLQAILKIFVVIFGIILVTVGVFSIIALVTSLFVSGEFIGISPFSDQMPHYLDLFVSSDTLSWFWVGLGLTIGIPLLMLAYLGTKLIFRFKSNNPAIGMSSLGLWVFGIIILICASVRGVSDFKSVATATKPETIITKSDTLYLKLGVDEFSDYLDSNINFDGLRLALINGKQFLLNEPRLGIEKSDSKDISIIIKSKARGYNPDRAQKNARDINYKFTQKDSLFTFQPWYMLPDKSVWHKQEVDIVLKVPENKVIYLSNEMVKIIHDIKNTSNMWDGDMGGKYWIMTPEGLELTQKKPAFVEPPKKQKK
ncbi:MAG: PspC domain-containing protein [Bacteroidia bacterium]|nr:PspC domain-containing protein [Bacteroidia bacterium]